MITLKKYLPSLIIGLMVISLVSANAVMSLAKELDANVPQLVDASDTVVTETTVEQTEIKLEAEAPQDEKAESMPAFAPADTSTGPGSIDLAAVIENAGIYSANGTWDPNGICWNPGQDGTFQFAVKLVDRTIDGDTELNTINPAACNDDFVSPVTDTHMGGIWPATGQTGNTFTLSAGPHEVCAILIHANSQGNDIDDDCQTIQVVGPQCSPDLDYVDGQGGGPDGNLTLGDAVVFTQRYVQAMYDHIYDATVDVNQNNINDVSDYECAVKYYGSALAPACPLECEAPVGISSVTGDICNSPLDYNNTQGVLGADGQLALSDAVEFTKRYEAAKGSQNGDGNYNLSVDVNFDGKVNAADYLCAQPYYGNAGPNDCQLNCANLCVNPIDFNEDYEITLSDASTFTTYYGNNDLRADLNQNGFVDYGDYDCSLDQIAMADYQCPIQCAPTCGDKTLTRRTGEQCDDGNNVENDGCSATCKIETACQEDLADFNNDGKITLADAVLFTPFYLNAQTEADIDANGETKLHDYTCMNQLLNVLVAIDEPQPLGIPTMAPIDPITTPNTVPNVGGSSKGGNYTLDLPAVSTTVPAGSFVGPLKITKEAPKSVVAPKNVTKPTVIKSKAGAKVAVLSAPAIKTGSDVDTATQATTESEQPKDSLIDKVGQLLRSIFVW